MDEQSSQKEHSLERARAAVDVESATSCVVTAAERLLSLVPLVLVSRRGVDRKLALASNATRLD